jgi:hypothetical protein
MSPYSWLTNGVCYDPGHDGPHEADAQDDDDFMALGAMIGDEGLEALEFSGFILRGGQGELFAVGGGRVLGSEF